MINKALFSSKKDDWETPHDLFNDLNNIYHFNLDPCSNEINYKCEKHFTKKENGLIQSWGGYNVFVNPPYGRGLYKWVEKCYNESKKDNTLVVLLIPSRTDTQYFHDFILDKSKIIFIKGRLTFVGATDPAPFPSLIAIWDNREEINYEK